MIFNNLIAYSGDGWLFEKENDKMAKYKIKK